MCGISGALDLDVTEEIAQKMLRTMGRRGPDANGVFQVAGCALLHSRLAVIDLAGGAQPMTWAGGDETFTIVYNGEIYNTGDVKEELRKLGHRFLTNSDTEVVLHAYGQWGENCVDHLNGIFAFAVWEHHSRRLYLARDRIGVKPRIASKLNELVGVLKNALGIRKAALV